MYYITLWWFTPYSLCLTAVPKCQTVCTWTPRFECSNLLWSLSYPYCRGNDWWVSRTNQSHKHSGTSCYFCAVQDSDSACLTTFNSPFWWFHFLHLPLGLACTKDTFLCMIFQILDVCVDAIGISGNIIVCGKNDMGHDQYLCKFMHLTCDYGLLATLRKLWYRPPGWHFSDVYKTLNVFTLTLTHPSTSSSHHQSLSQFQKFLWVVLYLTSFILSILMHTATLWDMLKKDVSYQWRMAYQKVFNYIKSLACSDTKLSYCEVHKAVIIQVDASKHGFCLPSSKLANPRHPHSKLLSQLSITPQTLNRSG